MAGTPLWPPSPKAPARLFQVTPERPVHLPLCPGAGPPWKQLTFSPQTYEMFSRFLQRLPGPHMQLLGHLGTGAAFAVQQVRQHEGSLGASGPARDLVDAFLLKMAKARKVRVGGPPGRPPSGWCSWDALSPSLFLSARRSVNAGLSPLHLLLPPASAPCPGLKPLDPLLSTLTVTSPHPHRTVPISYNGLLTKPCNRKLH